MIVNEGTFLKTLRKWTLDSSSFQVCDLFGKKADEIGLDYGIFNNRVVRDKMLKCLTRETESESSIGKAADEAYAIMNGVFSECSRNDLLDRNALERMKDFMETSGLSVIRGAVTILNNYGLKDDPKKEAENEMTEMELD